MKDRDSSIPTLEVQGRMLTPQQMLVIGALATTLYSGAANYFNGENGKPKLPAIDIEMESHHKVVAEHETPITVQDQDGSTTTVVDGRHGSGDTVDSSSRQTQIIADTMTERWARQFADDAESGRLIDPGEIDIFASSVKTELDQGWVIDGMSFRGTASAEDDSVNERGVRTAGLQVTTPEAAAKQDELGNERRDIGTMQLAAALQERGVSVDPAMIDLLPSIEDVLTDDEVIMVDQLAQSFGHVSTTQMIEQWNRDPASVDPAVDIVLTEFLAQERTFQVEVSMSRTSSAEERSVPESEQDTGDDGGTIKEHSEHEESETSKFRFLPIIIPGYIAFAIGRRKLPSNPTPHIVTEVPGAGPLPPRKTPVEAPPTHKPPKPPVPPTQRERFPHPKSDQMPKSQVTDTAFHRKQPRNHNFHGRAGHIAGGPGRMSRSRGGNRSGKR
ncbi:hypothetical protein KC968_00155 [Candidatus Saccharibacteria bacterium]|nr:hypothetical protein [Candidatus Saccharibacteria bacterium]